MTPGRPLPRLACFCSASVRTVSARTLRRWILASAVAPGLALAAAQAHAAPPGAQLLPDFQALSAAPRDPALPAAATASSPLLPVPPVSRVPPSVALQPCRLPGLATEARCGQVDRPLDAARPDGVRIAVHYAVVPALARRKAEDAVLFFAGGPGQSAIDLAGALAGRYARLNLQRDLVFIDQRGTGRSAPLSCPDDDPRAGLGPLAEQWNEAGRLERLAACRRSLQALAHGDLRHYATVAATGDVEAVRQALGIRRWNAIGGSYGTRAALDLLRQYPATVRRMVLDGVAPPAMRLHESAAADNAAAFAALERACRSQPACAARHPDLSATLASVLARLPAAVTFGHPLSGRLETLRLTADQLRSMLRAPLYAPALAAALPAALEAARDGRFQPLAALAASFGGPGMKFASGMHFSVVCSEDLGAPDPGRASQAKVPQAKATRSAGTAGAQPTSSEPTPSGPTSSVPTSSGPTPSGLTPSGLTPSGLTPSGPAAGARRPAPDAGGPFGDTFERRYRQACADWPRADVPAAFFTVPASASPVLLLSGGIDPVTPPRHAEAAAAALGPKARHVVVPEAGHGVAALACARPAVHAFLSLDDDAEALERSARMLAGCAAELPRPPAFELPGTPAGAGSNASSVSVPAPGAPTARRQ